MSRTGRTATYILVSMVFMTLLGCGKEAKEEKKEEVSKEEFRIPDSLLAPIAGYNLTRDDYHPVRGGVMANDIIELHYPARTIARFIAVRSFGIAQSAYRKVAEEIGKPAEEKLVLIGTKDLDEYMLLTRKEWWYYGYIQGDTIYFEPFNILLKRGIADMAIMQKIAQLALIRRSGNRMPLWLREALASRIAGEGEVLKIQIEQSRAAGWDVNPPPAKIEQDLADALDRSDTRVAFYAAYRMLENLLSSSSLEDVFEFIDKLQAGSTLNEASREVFGMNYDALLNGIRVDREAGGSALKQ